MSCYTRNVSVNIFVGFLDWLIWTRAIVSAIFKDMIIIATMSLQKKYISKLTSC